MLKRRDPEIEEQDRLATRNGTEGPDTLTGTSEPDDITGAGGDDELFGLGDDDAIEGGEGNDLIDGGTGADSMAGGIGNDIFVVDDAGDQLFEISGTDEIRTSLAAFTLSADFENLTGTSDGGQTLVGNDGANVIVGGGGTDTLDGGLGNDVLHVGAGDLATGGDGTDEVRTALSVYALPDDVEYLTGTSASGQELIGNDLRNVIRGGAGTDTMRGGRGADTYYVGEGDIVADGGDDAARDRVFTDLEEYFLPDSVADVRGTGDGQHLVGNRGYNIIIGTNGDDVLENGGGSRDTLNGRNGNDLYFVVGENTDIRDSDGIDEVRTSNASYSLNGLIEILTGTSPTGQSLVGNYKDNTITGNVGSDTLTGRDGDDFLDGGDGDDTMVGGKDNDIYVVDSVGDAVSELANEGTDEVRTNLATYALGDEIEDLTGTSDQGQHLIGGAGVNMIMAGAGADQLEGSFGDDVLEGGLGDDSLSGGTGFDTAAYDQADSRVSVSLLVSGGQDTGGAGNDTLDSIENLTGSDFNDLLEGSLDANTVSGGAGNDRLRGDKGDDTLIGGAGVDTATYFEAEAGVLIDLARTDRQVASGAGADLLLDIENVTGSTFADDLRGTAGANRFDGSGGKDRLFGRDGADILNGGDADDLLHGGSGADRMAGDAGDDIYIVDNVGDLGIERAGEGRDMVKSSVDFRLGRNVEQLLLRGNALDGFGNESDNLILGNGGANGLYGGSGDDSLRGGAEADRLKGGAGSDVLRGGIGADTLLGGEDSDELHGGDQRDSLQGEGGADRLEGEAADDTLLGGSGSDVLVGGEGRDFLNGGAGRDIMNGGAGADRFLFDDGDSAAALDEADRITDFSHADGDRIHLRRIDADTTADGDQNFQFIGEAAFSGAAGELRYETINGHTYVQADVDGDGLANLSIRLDGDLPLTASDFVL